MAFTSSMAAKKFLVSRIVEEARRQGVKLSEAEEKMLYYSETYESLPQIEEVSAQFDREYNSDDYEDKIHKLSRAAYKHDRKASAEIATRWRDAVHLLKKEDHYILVMVDAPRSARDASMLVLIGVVVTAFGLCVFITADWIQQNVSSRIPNWIPSVAIAGFLVALIYFGMNDTAERKTEKWMGRIYKRFTHRKQKSG